MLDYNKRVERIVSHSALTDWVAKVFVACEVSQPDARLTASVLVRTNLRGIDTHGVMRVPPYVEKLRSGEVNAHAAPEVEKRDGVLFCNGKGGLGQVTATFAVREAIAFARETAVAPCVIRDCGHLAALGLFVLAAAEEGMIAILCQETPPLMALAGSPRPTIGNNPIAFAMPVSGQAPLVFDMATSVVARGNVLSAARNREPLPDGWAIGPDGEPTNDPVVALKGAMLPIAGHKGIGLAMMVQALAGSLSGSNTAASAATYGSTSSAGNVGAFVMVINPERFAGRTAFDDHVQAWITSYVAASGNSARYPGQRAAQCERERLESGIPLAASAIADLEKTGEIVSVPFDVPGLSGGGELSDDPVAALSSRTA